jgi:hypothetical protein
METTMPNRHQRRTQTARNRSRRFELPLSDISRQFDAVFIGSDQYQGEVVAQAGSDGQRAIERLLPNSCIAWRELDASNPLHLPNDWREFCFNVLELVDVPGHRLQRDLLALKPLEEISPDQFAFLMMMSTNEQDARTAFFSLTERRLISATMPSQHN